MGTERGGCSRLMKTPRHNGGAVHSRSMRAKKKDNHCSGRPCIDWLCQSLTDRNIIANLTQKSNLKSDRKGL